MAHEGHDHHHHDDAPHSHDHHHHDSAAPIPASSNATTVACFVITVSDTRTEKDDVGGQSISTMLTQVGHSIVGHDIVRDEKSAIVEAIHHGIAHGARVIILTGGTGISRRDVTLESVEPLFEKHVPGFGETFRALSFAEIGPRAMLSRATAGTISGVLVFALPGSPNAVKLGIEKLILPELSHFVRMVSQ